MLWLSGVFIKVEIFMEDNLGYGIRESNLFLVFFGDRLLKLWYIGCYGF